MKRCEPFQDFSGRQFYIPMDNGRSLGTGTNGNPCSFKPTTSSLNWSEGFASVDTRYQLSQNHSIGYSSFEKQFLEPAPTTYARPDFVPYTQPSHSFIPKPKYVTPIVDSSLQGNISKQQVVGKVLSEASKYGLNTVGYQSQVNKMSTDDLSKKYQNWKVLEKQITVGKVLSEADKYGLNNSVYQQQVNTMSDYELSKQYQEWRALEKRILVGKVLTQYSEATGKSIDEIDEQTKSDLNNADQASLEKIYEDNIKNKQVVLVGTILSQVNEISGKPLNELDQETIDFVNNSELATLQLIYNTNVNQKQLLENGTVGLYELYFRLPVNVSYNILYNPGHFNSDISKLLTRKLDLNNISNLNLSNNQIGDDGAKLLADSLLNGKFPHLKTLRLEGNKITDEGQDALVNVLKNETVQSIIITTMTVFEKYQLNINGSDDRKMSIYENRLEQAKARGVDVDNVVVERTTWDWIKNKVKFSTKLSFGWVKCMVTYDDVPSFAGERLLAKLSSRTSLANDAKDSLLCYFEAENDALQTEEGVKHTKYQMLDVITSPELTGNIEAWYDTLYH